MEQAAESAGLSKKSFVELLNDYDVPVINQLSIDMENDIDNARG